MRNCRLFLREPALLVGLSALIGSAAPLFWEEPWNWIFPTLWALMLLFFRQKLAFAMIPATVLYVCWFYTPLQNLETPVHGTAKFSPTLIHSNTGSKSAANTLYRGTLSGFGCSTIPCTIYWKGPEKNRPPATKSYEIKGTLYPSSSPYTFLWKPDKNSAWIPLPYTWSLAEQRAQWKKSLKQTIELTPLTPPNRQFLSALITGDSESPELRWSFSRLGLQHLLAVSGFHFALIAALAHLFCRPFLPPRISLWATAIFLGLYFLFIGHSPSAMRGWLTAELWILGKILYRHVSSLNLLGFVMLCELLMDPLISSQIGFQLSFLSCAGILCFYPLLRKKFMQIIPKRPPQELQKMRHSSHYGYLLAVTLREALSLGVAVNLTIAPLLLYHFHEFPLMSLFYNLFIPLLTTLAFTSFGVAMLLPLVGKPLFIVANWITTQILLMVNYPPPLLDYSITTTHIPIWVLLLYWFGLFTFYLYGNRKNML